MFVRFVLIFLFNYLFFSLFFIYFFLYKALMSYKDEHKGRPPRNLMLI